MGITFLKNEDGSTFLAGGNKALSSWAFEFDDGTSLRTGFGRDGVLTAQNLASTEKYVSSLPQFANKSVTIEDLLPFSVEAREIYEARNKTQEEKISELADVKYLSQNTGVLSADLVNAAYNLGLDVTGNYDQEINNFLNKSGYNVGENPDFYANTTGPVDAAAKILNDQWQKSLEVEEKIEGTDKILVNNNVANSLFVAQELSKQNINPADTFAMIRTDYGVSNIPGAALQKDPVTGEVTSVPSTTPVKSTDLLVNPEVSDVFDTPDDNTLNILEWDDFLKPKLDQFTPTETLSGQPVTVQEVADVPAPQATPGVVTKADPATLDIGSDAITPYFNPPNTTPTSTTVTPAQDFSAGITRQGTAFDARTAQQAQFFQPQTLAEMEDAGKDTSAFTLTQKLFRNPLTGQQIYIPHYGDQPASPIPAGFVKVDVTGQTPFIQAPAFNPVTASQQYTPPAAVNQGGVIQGFTNGGANFVNRFNPETGFYEYGDQTNLTQEQYQSLVAESQANTGGGAGGGGTEGGANPSSIYGDVFFQDPVSGQLVKQSPSEYLQTQQNIEAQTRVNPASAVAPMGVQYLTEVKAPGTVIEATAGRAIPVAPVIAGNQVAQVSDVTQSTGAVNPGAAQMSLTQAAPTVKAQDFSAATQQVPARDAQGNVLTDAQGNPIMVSAPTREITAQQTTAPSIGQPLTDAQGNVLRDAEGNVIFNVEAATGTATDVTAPTTRTLQRTRVPLKNEDGTVVRDTDGNIMYEGSELISGSTVDTSKVDTAFGTGKVEAASITGELATLMKDFEGGDTPSWAAGAMRQATAIMNERGLGASTMAGQAIVQAAMEAALPIAQVEAGNKQQIAMFNAQQRANFLKLDFDQKFQAKVQNAARVSEIANMNFSADQTIALENSRAANTVNLNNLSNRQGVIMAEAAALSQLDMANLNNRQQANVQNAQNFLQLDMANLSNSQQTALFQQQSLVNSILSDAAAANAAAQFNASSENQTNQFFSNLAAQVSQFNSAQKNAIDQFNAEETNAVLEFNSALQNQREMFNAQNYLVVAQANAAWRQAINTANTEAQNLSNAQYAKDINGLTQKTLDNYWQKERDIMSFFMASDESDKDRALRLLLAEQSAEAAREQLEMVEQTAKSAFIADLFIPNKFNIGDAIFKSV